MKLASSFLAALCVLVSVAQAQPASAPVQLPPTITTVTPIYSQILAFSQPTQFKVVFEQDSGTNYLREAVLDGETVDQWSQMLTTTGAKGLATNGNVTPRRFVEFIASAFQKSCPASFKAAAVLEGNLPGGQAAYSALVGCGSSKSSAGTYSEIALITAIRGESDFYTVQWAERGSPVEGPVSLDGHLWADRLKSLLPFKVCPRVPGEPAPFPSCLAAK